MAAPRSIQFIALRNLARAGHQTRNLSMTGPTTYASRNLMAEDKVESARARHAVSKQDPAASHPSTTGTPSRRNFNTSRTLKHPNDTSPIDLAFLPTFETTPSNGPSAFTSRIPILTSTTATGLPISSASPSTTSPAPLAEPTVMRPQIATAADDVSAVCQPLTELSDGHAEGVDFRAVAETVAREVSRTVAGVVRGEGSGAAAKGNMVGEEVGRMVEGFVGGVLRKKGGMAPV